MKTLVYINKKMKTSVFYFIAFLAIAGLLQACKPKTCSMPPEAGSCMAAIPRYYYNQQTGQCEQFIWGGCGDFPFETMQSCEDACE